MSDRTRLCEVTVPFEPGEIPSGLFASIEVIWERAEPGMVVLCSMVPAPADGHLLSGAIHQPGQVRVILLNTTPVPATVAEGFLRIILWD